MEYVNKGLTMSIKSKWLHNFLFFVTVLILLIVSQEFALAQAAGGGGTEGYDDSKFGVACISALNYLQGGFGALLSAIAGFAAVIASAMGGFRMAWGLLIVSIGSFILQEYMEIWFGTSACVGS